MHEGNPMIDDDAIKNIEKLHKLKQDGVITEADFDAAKAQLLLGPKPRQTPAGSLQSRVATLTQQGVEIPTPAQNDHFGWMTLALRKYADFSGRSCRKEFWMFQLMTNAVVFTLLVLFVADTQAYTGPGALAVMATACIILFLLAMVVPALAVMARRFHDQGYSGFYVLMNLIPYLGTLAAIIFMLLDGEAGENEYGPDPKQR